MASIDDLMGVQKNGVNALGNIYNLQRRVAGTTTSATVSASTVIVTGKGRLVSYTVVVSGSSDGGIHDLASTSGGTAANTLVPTDHTKLGVVVCGLEFQNGLLVTPGTGQSVNVTYATG